MERFDVNSFYIDDVLDFVKYERAGKKYEKEKVRHVRKHDNDIGSKENGSNSWRSENFDQWKEEFDY